MNIEIITIPLFPTYFKATDTMKFFLFIVNIRIYKCTRCKITINSKLIRTWNCNRSSVMVM